MKRHVSSIVFGVTGVCVGFTVCFLQFVLPTREPLRKGTEAQQALKVYSKLSISYDKERGTYFTMP
jgi:hypothetical protein